MTGNPPTGKSATWRGDPVTPTAEEQAFLERHVWTVLATAKADGSPQQSTVLYTLDDSRPLVSTRSHPRSGATPSASRA